MNPLLPELVDLQGFSVRKNKSPKPIVLTVSDFCGGGKGIRTLVGLLPNGFQDRLVMTTSISLHMGKPFPQEELYHIPRILSRVNLHFSTAGKHSSLV